MTGLPAHSVPARFLYDRDLRAAQLAAQRAAHVAVVDLHEIAAYQANRALGRAAPANEYERAVAIRDFIHGAGIVDRAWADRANKTLRELGLAERNE